ncbi:2-C-methyl-D-erythritol 4-phosphate cytidylyltransferase [Streptomyces sp. 6N223]|uniref:2-C-methyl-D-erythritol 4-phosphate cytidylyltransferase n=1 Tax=Streptomyces sp. 6N223 TaxID=3457412 RepID=UPI003FD46812
MSDTPHSRPLPGDGPGTPAGPAGRARTAAVIPAAGRGVRLGPGAPKALRQLNGTPILVHAVRAMAQAREVSVVVVVAPPEEVQGVRVMLLDEYPPPTTAGPVDLMVVPGGRTRQESVGLGLAALPDDVEVVLVHDAARPLVPVETVDAVAAAVLAGAPAVVPALPLADTVKRIAAPARDGGPEEVVSTPDRSMLRAVQTPQGFDRATLVAAHRKLAADAEAGAGPGIGGGEGATDDAGMVERMGVPVVLVPGHEEAFKVTRPLDLVLAEAVLARRRQTDGF